MESDYHHHHYEMKYARIRHVWEKKKKKESCSYKNGSNLCACVPIEKSEEEDRKHVRVTSN